MQDAGLENTSRESNNIYRGSLRPRVVRLALIKELANKRAKHRAEGTEVARLRRRLSFTLQQALSFRNATSSLQAANRSVLKARCLCKRLASRGETGSEGKEGVNGDADGNGHMNKNGERGKQGRELSNPPHHDRSRVK